jgi:glycerate kinase
LPDARHRSSRGIPAALVAFCKARILRGSECILDLLGFNDAVKWADLIITGEGKLIPQFK